MARSGTDGGPPAPYDHFRIGPGDRMHTGVQVHNYCGQAPPRPVTVAFRDGILFVVADPLGGDVTSGVPSCIGGTGSITMQPWTP